MSVSTSASFEYLEQLPGTTFRRLYQQPSTALAIFRRMLPHLAKSFVMALLYMTKSLPMTDLELWVVPDSRSQQKQALGILTRLHIITITVPTAESPQMVALTKNFGTSLRLALTGGGDHESFGIPSNDSATTNIDDTFLDTYATEQWEGILHYVVNSVGEFVRNGAQSGPTPSVKKLLEIGNLVNKGRGSGGGITQAGFSFLLQEVNAQVWTILLLWIENAEQMGFDSVEVLSFLFMLGSLELGRTYSTSKLSDTQHEMLKYLVDFGLVYIPPSAPGDFYPSRLATTLTSDASALRTVSAGFNAAMSGAGGAGGDKGFIIIETNYRLYAYTNSPLQIAVLALFTRFNTRYPNMVSGRITRQSVYGAISHGITSDQIITYLTTHAHPQLVMNATTHGGPVVPPTVVDQIRLWQIENERMKATPGVCFSEFDSLKEYQDVSRYGEEIGVVVYKNDARRLFFATKIEQLRDFVKAYKARSAK